MKDTPLLGGQFNMADIRRKRATDRRAVAVGELIAGPKAYAAIVARQLPKGDALLLAEMAGIQGAKHASQWMPLCHPLNLEWVQVRHLAIPERCAIRMYCETALSARTGVEMEALAGVNAALLTLYDLTKPVEPALSLSGIRLLFKEGGKKGLWIHPEGLNEAEHAWFKPRAIPNLDGIRAAVITLSDRASAALAARQVSDADLAARQTSDAAPFAANAYVDESGPLAVSALAQLSCQAQHVLLADDPEALKDTLSRFAADGVQLVVCTGGTGLGPRDSTPEALDQLSTRTVPGIAELFRSASSAHTPMAWLSRAKAVVVADTMLVIALPGSVKAVDQGMAILAPLLAHALAMLAGKSHA